MKQWSPSLGPLLAKCTWVLTDDAEWVPEEETEPMRLGTETHNEFERICTHEGEGPPPVDATKLSQRLADAAYDVLLSHYGTSCFAAGQVWAGVVFRNEFKLCVDLETLEGRRIFLEGHRNYGELRSSEVAGSLDLLVHMTETEAEVVDLKVGRSPPSATSLQLAIYAAMAMVVYGYETIHCRILAVHSETEQARLSERVTYDQNALWSILGWLQAIRANIAAAVPQPGTHCTDLSCPARFTCPAVQGEVKGLLRPDAMTVKFRGVRAIESAKEAEHLWPIWQALRDTESRLASELRKWADDHGGVQVSPSHMWQKTWREVESVDMDDPASIELIEGMGLSSLIEKKISWAALEARLGRKEANSIRKALSAAGLLKKGRHPRYELTPIRRTDEPHAALLPAQPARELERTHADGPATQAESTGSGGASPEVGSEHATAVAPKRQRRKAVHGVGGAGEPARREVQPEGVQGPAEVERS